MKRLSVGLGPRAQCLSRERSWKSRMLRRIVVLLLFLAECLGTPLRRRKVETNGVKIPPIGTKGEEQWERVNEDVHPNHLEGLRLHRDGEFNEVKSLPIVEA